MIIGIDAHNIRGHGGAVNHLFELLYHIKPEEFNIKKIIVWSNSSTLDKLPERYFIKKVADPILEKNLLFRIAWQIFKLAKEAKKEKCDVLFVPGGIFLSNFKPFVAMAQNLLPFDYEVRKIYKGTAKYYKLLLHEKLLKYSFRRAKGIIFISKTSRDIILSKIKQLNAKHTVIYHGVNERFYFEGERKQSEEKKILIVADLSLHKGYKELIEALIELYNEGEKIKVTIVGGLSDNYSNKVLENIRKITEEYSFIKYMGEIDYSEMHKIYFENEYFVFASQCEAFGMPLVEAMAANMKIACSDIPVFNEIMEQDGVSFDVYNKREVLNRIKQLLYKKQNKSEKKLYFNYSWENNSNNTIIFFKKLI